MRVQWLCRWLCLLCLLGFAVRVRAQEKPSLVLAEDGRTSYVIAVATDAAPPERTAAEQLQKYLRQVTGAPFYLRDEKDVEESAPQIVVGRGPRAVKMLPGQDFGSLKTDGIIIKTVGNSLVLSGGRPRGTLYAVFQFLENAVGCRWWTPTENMIPRKPTLRIEPQDTVFVPPLDYREVHTTAVTEPSDFQTILKQNGYHEDQTEEWGGHYTFSWGFVHTSTDLLPPTKYFKEHPEWYTDPTRGDLPCTAASPMPEHYVTQICFSNEEARKELTKNALMRIKQNPNAQLLCVSQNDDRHYCKCAQCAQLTKSEGSVSGPLLKFVNGVAEEVHQTYPDLPVMTLAYAWTIKPPRTIRPAKNVRIWFAPINADFGQPFDSHWNKEYRDAFFGWKAIAPDIWVWNYTINFQRHMLPHPNLPFLAQDIRFYVQNGVKGVFEQSDNSTWGVGNFVSLRAWLMGHLLWNPDLDQEALTQEYMQGYFGPAAPYLRRYLDLVQDSFDKSNRGLILDNLDFSFLTLDVMNQGTELFQQAQEAVANDSVLARRVQRERISLNLAWLQRYYVLRQSAQLQGKPFLGPADPKQGAEEAILMAREFNAWRYPYSQSYRNFEKWVRSVVEPPKTTALPREFQRKAAVDIVDIQQDKFLLTAPGGLSSAVDDPLASDGKAGRMRGGSEEKPPQDRLLQVRMFDYGDLLSQGTWRGYALVRVQARDGAAPQKTALSYGIDDLYSEKSIFKASRSLIQLPAGQYHLLDYGVLKLNSGANFWFSPDGNPDTEAVFVDRVLVVRQ